MFHYIIFGSVQSRNTRVKFGDGLTRVSVLTRTGRREDPRHATHAVRKKNKKLMTRACVSLRILRSSLFKIFAIWAHNLLWLGIAVEVKLNKDNVRISIY